MVALEQTLNSFLVLLTIFVSPLQGNANGPSASALMDLVKNDKVDQLRKILNAGLSVNEPVSHGTTLLMNAAIYGKPRSVAMLISQKADLDRVDWLGVTALGYSVVNERNEITDLLLKAGASVDGGKGGYPPLVAASGYRLDRFVRKLLAHGAKVDSHDPHGYTALMQAARLGNSRIVTILLSSGANRSLVNDRGETALTLAQQGKHEGVVRLLNERPG